MKVLQVCKIKINIDLNSEYFMQPKIECLLFQYAINNLILSAVNLVSNYLTYKMATVQYIGSFVLSFVSF